MEPIAGSSLDFGFTNSLIKILKESNGGPRTVAQLHARLVRDVFAHNLEGAPVHGLGPDMHDNILMQRLGEPVSPGAQAPASGLAGGEPLVLLKILITNGELPDSYRAMEEMAFNISSIPYRQHRRVP